MRKRLWKAIIKKLENPLKTISVAVTILVIFNYTIDAVIASSKIIVELNETKITTIENPSRRINDRPSITDRQTESGTRDTEGTNESIEEKIRETFGEEGDLACAVAKCESMLNPIIVGDKHMTKHSYGIFQINRTWHDYTPEQLIDPDFNIKIAKEIKDNGGWNRWSCYSGGGYLKYL